MSAEVQALFQALETLTNQVKYLAEHQQTRSGGKLWHSVENFKNLKVFAGETKEYEEFSTKLRSQVAAGDPRVAKMMACVEKDCSEEMLAQGKYDETAPEFDGDDMEFILKSSSEMYNLLLNRTTGEANAMVRRCAGQGWLAWKKLTASLNPRTLASGIKQISAVLSPRKIAQATKADMEIEQWEDKMTRLNVEYGQELSAKMKVAVLYSMLPKDLQEKVLDECSVNWDGIQEAQAAEKFMKIKANIKNIAKSRRELMGPKPIEVDRVSASWADWSGDWEGEWGTETTEQTNKDADTDNKEMAYVQYIGFKGGKKGGKGFQGNCFVCGEFGHSQWDCRKGKGKGFGKEGGFGKGFGKSGEVGKGGWFNKGYGKGEYGKGGGYSKGTARAATWERGACKGLVSHAGRWSTS